MSFFSSAEFDLSEVGRVGGQRFIMCAKDVCLYACMIYVCMQHIRRYACVYICIYVCVCTGSVIRIRICICMSMCICVYIHI